MKRITKAYRIRLQLLRLGALALAVCASSCAFLSGRGDYRNFALSDRPFEARLTASVPTNACGVLRVVSFNVRYSKEIARALEQTAKDPTMQYHSAMINAAAGEGPAALATLEALMAEEVVFAERKDAQKLLQELQ